MISTTQEAINEIRCDMCIRHEEMTDDLYEALDMAINALAAQEQLSNDSPKLDSEFGDLISRAAAIDALEKVAELYPWRVPGDRDSYSQYNEAWQDALNRADSEIEALPSAQPKIIHCGECSYFKSSTSIYGECMCHDMWQSLYGDTPEVDAIVVHKDHYCGYAERRDNEGD